MHLRNLLRPFYLAGRLQNWLYEKRLPITPGSRRRPLRGWRITSALTCAHGSGAADAAPSGSRAASPTSPASKAMPHGARKSPAWFATPASPTSNYAISRSITPSRTPIRTTTIPCPAIPPPSSPESNVSLALVVVDGWYRPVCARAALPKLTPGGLLLIDNTDWKHPPHVHVPQDWPLVHQSRNVMTQTSIWRKPA